jgi:hypothetical protein
MLTATELMACADCLFYVANGDGAEDVDLGALERRIQRTIGHPSGVLACGDWDQDEEFSWSQCECCGSRLGGSRHQLVMLLPEGVAA